METNSLKKLARYEVEGETERETQIETNSVKAGLKMGIGRRVPVGPQRNILGVPKQRPSHITLFVHDHPSGNDVVFRLKRSTQLRRLMIAYCDRKSVEFNRIGFFHHGVRLISSRTPDEYDFWSGDVIWAHPVLRGGAP